METASGRNPPLECSDCRRAMDLFNIPAFRPEARPGDRLTARPLWQRPRTYTRQSCTALSAAPAGGAGNAGLSVPLLGAGAVGQAVRAGGQSQSGVTVPVWLAWTPEREDSVSRSSPALEIGHVNDLGSPLPDGVRRITGP